MERIWAPWRDAYIQQFPKKGKGCIFCRLLKAKKDKQNLIFVRAEHCFAVLNKYPYNNGHCLVLPNRHVADLARLKAEEKEGLFELLIYVQKLLDQALKPQGYNVGMNLGKVAGAGEPGHLHFHIVPRWRGDVNFMPIIGNTKVVSQSLSACWEALALAQQAMTATRKKGSKKK